MSKENTSRDDCLEDIINENIVDSKVASEFYKAVNRGGAKILSFWSLDKDTQNIEPLKRYHAGHLAFMLFLAKLLSSEKKCLIEANICDDYSLVSEKSKQIKKSKESKESEVPEEYSLFFSSHKSWREGRINMRNFLDRAFLESKDNFVIFNLRDEFQKTNTHSKKLFQDAKRVWREIKKILEDHCNKDYEGYCYRYPKNIPVDERIKEIRSILKANIWGDITIEETITVLYVWSANPNWLHTEWTSKFVAYWAYKFLHNEENEYILEGERGCYSWRFHLLLAKVIAFKNKDIIPNFKKLQNFKKIQIIPFRDIPDIDNQTFMKFEFHKKALFLQEILNTTLAKKKLRKFKSSNKSGAMNRINILLRSLTDTSSISGFIFNIAAKLSNFPTEDIQILHISDIHCGYGFNFGSKASKVEWSPTNRLPSYLQKRLEIEKPHFLLISGDFTSICRKGEFTQAEVFISKLIKSKSLQYLKGKKKIYRHQIMAVPGNHDFAWDLNGGHQARNFKQFVKRVGILSPWSDDSPICDVIPPDNGGPVKAMYFEDLGIAIILACSTEGTLPYSDKIEDYKTMRLGKKKLTEKQWDIIRELLNQDRPKFSPDYESSLSSCLDKLSEKKGGQNAKLIFMSHHNVDQVGHESSPPKNTEAMIRVLESENAMLWLHGHIHVPYLRTTKKGLTICGAGTLGGWTVEGHSANIIHIGKLNNHRNYLSKLKFSTYEGDFQISYFDEK